MVKPYRLHIFICEGKRCAARGSAAVVEEFKRRVKEEGIKGVRVSRSGCLKACKETRREGEYSPAVVIYPEGTWYRNVGAGDVSEIIEEHLKKGRVVERLFYYSLPAG